MITENEIFYNKVCETIAKYRNKGMRELVKIATSKQSEELLRADYRGDIYDVEQFKVLYLNHHNKPIIIKTIGVDGITFCPVDIRVIMRHALICKATGMILCHNHPSESKRPSENDIRITNIIKEACKVMEIALYDHIIISGESYYSFADEGLI